MFSLGLLLAIVCAIFWTALDAARKSLAESMSTTAVLVGLHLFQLPCLALLLVWGAARGPGDADDPWALMLGDGFPDAWLDPSYLVPGSISLVVSLAAMALFLKALQRSPLSLTVPYLAFTPIFSAIGGLLVLGQTPTSWGWVGIVTVGVGAFMLNPGDAKEGIWAPLKALWTERGSLYMLGVAAGWSITAVYDTQAAQATSATWHAMVLSVGIAGAVVIQRVATDQSLKPLGRELRSRAWYMLGASLLLVGGMILQMTAYTLLGVAYVETIKRGLGIIGSIAIGYLIWKEEDVGRRLGAALVITVGVAILLLGG